MLSGEATWAGYNFVNDTASNFVVTDVLEHHGVITPEGLSGTTNNAANLLTSGYPLGAFSLLAGVRPLTGAPLEAVYQPAMAVFAGLAAHVADGDRPARRACARRPRWWRPASRSAGSCCTGTCSTVRSRRSCWSRCWPPASRSPACVAERRLELRTVVPVALVGLACVLVFSVAAGAYVLALAGATAVVVALSPERPSWAAVWRLVGVGCGRARGRPAADGRLHARLRVGARQPVLRRPAT